MAISKSIEVLSMPTSEINNAYREEIQAAAVEVARNLGTDVAFSYLRAAVSRGLERPLAIVCVNKVMCETGDFGKAAGIARYIFELDERDDYVSYFYGVALAAAGDFSQLRDLSRGVASMLCRDKVRQTTVSRWATLLLQLGMFAEAEPFVLSLEEGPICDILTRRFWSYKDSWVQSDLPIHVINLRKDERKRRITSRVLANAGYRNVNILAAVEATTLPDSVFRAVLADTPLARSLGAGTVGCWLSHVSAWEEIANGHDTWSIVVEDDVIPEFHSSALVDLLPQLESYDFVWLNDRMSGMSNSIGDQTKPEPIDPWGLFAYWGEGRTAVGAYAYMLKREAAERLVSLAAASGVCGHIDGLMAAWTVGKHVNPTNRIQNLLCEFQNKYGFLDGVRAAALSVPLFKEEDYGVSSRDRAAKNKP